MSDMRDGEDGGASPPETSVIRNLLRSEGAIRSRVVDDHMFAVSSASGGPATFRLQLFAAPGTRPVAVATQTLSEGMSLINAAEEYASAVWQRMCPECLDGPIWIEHLLDRDGRSGRFRLVVFSVDGGYELSAPSWYPISAGQLARLVGEVVDEDRGSGFVPRLREPEEELRYKVVWVWRMPRPNPFRARKCMPAGISWRTRLWRQLFPRRRVMDCCEYHSVDWHRVSRSVVRIARQASRTGLRGDDLADKAYDLVDAAQRLTPAERAAAATLISPAEGIQLLRPKSWRTSYVNGQHRSQAMLDAGVRRTVIVCWELPNPAG